MDQFILTHSEKARIHISYSSLSNPRDQYHRNANQPVQSNDLIKLPVYLYALDQLNKGFLDIDEAFKIRQERLLRNKEGMFGPEDVDRLVSTEEILHAVSTFNDNAACNMLLTRLGKNAFQDLTASYKLNSLYLLGELDDRTKHSTLNAKNFISSGDIVNFQKKILEQLTESRKGRTLIKTYLLNNNRDESVQLQNNNPVVKWTENTSLCKGTNYINSDNNGFILTILISSFQNESEASELLEKAERVFFDNFEKLSLK